MLYYLRCSLYDIGAALQFTELLVTTIQIAIYRCPFRVRAVFAFKAGRHGALGVVNVRVYSRHDGSTHRRTQRTGLFRFYCFNGSIQHIGQYLHHIGGLFANPTGSDDFLHGNPLGLEAIDNSF